MVTNKIKALRPNTDNLLTTSAISGANPATVTPILKLNEQAVMRYSGAKISDIYPDLISVCDSILTNKTEEVDILFLF